MSSLANNWTCPRCALWGSGAFWAGSNAHLLAYGDIVTPSGVTIFAGRDASATAYGAFNADLTAMRDILHVWSVGNLSGTLSAARDIAGGGSFGPPAFGNGSALFSEGTINASVSAGRRIGNVSAWSNVMGSFTAGSTIGKVTAGGNILASFNPLPLWMSPFDLALQQAASNGNTAAPASIVPEILAEANAAYQKLVTARQQTSDAFDDVMDEYDDARNDTSTALNTARNDVITANIQTATKAATKATNERDAFRGDLNNRSLAAAQALTNSVNTTNQRRTTEGAKRDAEWVKYDNDATAAVNNANQQRLNLDDNNDTTTFDYATQLKSARKSSTDAAQQAHDAWMESFKPWLKQQAEKFGKFVQDLEKEIKAQGTYDSFANGVVGELIVRPLAGDHVLIRNDVGDFTIALYVSGKIVGLVHPAGAVAAVIAEIAMNGLNPEAIMELAFTGVFCRIRSLGWVARGLMSLSAAMNVIQGATRTVAAINAIRKDGPKLEHLRELMGGAFQLAEAARRQPQCFPPDSAVVRQRRHRLLDGDESLLVIVPNDESGWNGYVLAISAVFAAALLALRRETQRKRKESQIDSFFSGDELPELWHPRE